MNFYPVVIPTLNRYTHFKRCVESLAMNTHADKTELIIGLDYPPSEKYVEGYRKIKEYIPTIKGFGKVTVFKRKENFGAIKNGQALSDYAFKNYEAIIFTEDDNEFSPCFLDFLNKALEKYKDDNRVSSVKGYNRVQYYSITDKNILFMHNCGAWGFGQWKRKRFMLQADIESARRILQSTKQSWKIFRTSPAIFSMLLAMVKKNALWGDVIFACLNILNDRYQICPRISMVRNWGVDGSGLHSGVDDTYSRQVIQTAPYFDLDDVEPGSDPNTENTNALFYNKMPDNRFRAWYHIILTAMKYLVYRLYH